jgi:DNA repair exonuclease SbcCD ATPase subunit
MEEQIDEKYRTRIDSLISEKSSISAIASIKEEEKEELQKEILELKKKSEKEKDELKKQIDELKSYLTKSKDELISKKEEFEENVEQLQFQRALIEARANGESDDFLSMLIKSAYLYGKEEFQASFDKLLKYQPEDKFMFAYVFNEIETKNYDYLEDFLNTRKIPEQPNTLISQIMETSFKSSPQTRL